MRGSIGLAAYRSLAGRRTVPDYTPAHPRPRGEVVWIHAAETGNTRAVIDLALLLVAMRYGTQVVLTTAQDDIDLRGATGVLIEPLPDDHPAVADAFMRHWQPDVLIWTWGGLQPNLILEAAKQGTYMMLVDAASNGFDGRRHRWLPEVAKRVIAAFDHVIVRNDAARLRLAHLGRAHRDIELGSPLQPFGQTLPAADSDIADMADALGGGPLGWRPAPPAKKGGYCWVRTGWPCARHTVCC